MEMKELPFSRAVHKYGYDFMEKIWGPVHLAENPIRWKNSLGLGSFKDVKSEVENTLTTIRVRKLNFEDAKLKTQERSFTVKDRSWNVRTFEYKDLGMKIFVWRWTWTDEFTGMSGSEPKCCSCSALLFRRTVIFQFTFFLSFSFDISCKIHSEH